MQRATVDLPEPLSPTMPSVRPLRKRQRDVLGGGDFAGFAEERALAIDLAEFVGFQHHRFVGLGARRARHQARHRREQVAGVFHGRRAQDGVERAGLDQPAVAHHRDAVGDLGDHAHVMGDEQHGGAVIALQVADQGQDLLLRGDVERGGRLVRDQQFRLQHQRHRDHDALALAAGQPVRVGGEDALDLGQPDLLHHRQDAFWRRARASRSVWTRSTSSIWRPTGTTGLSAVIGSWKIIAIVVARNCRSRRSLAVEQFLADQLDAAAGGHQRALLQQAHHGQRGHRFARAAFADQAQRLAFVHLQRDAVDDALAAAASCRGRRRGCRCRERCWSCHDLSAVIARSAATIAHP